MYKYIQTANKLTELSSVKSENYYKITNGDFESESIYTYKSENEDIVKYSKEFIADASFALQKINERSLAIKSLFLPRAVPYRGLINQNNDCYNQKSFNKTPVETDRDLVLFINVKTTPEFIIGICPSLNNSINAQVIFLYCKTTRLFYEIRYYTKSELPELNDKPIIGCY